MIKQRSIVHNLYLDFLVFLGRSIGKKSGQFTGGKTRHKNGTGVDQVNSTGKRKMLTTLFIHKEINLVPMLSPEITPHVLNVVCPS